jgi:hypothetical protein
MGSGISNIFDPIKALGGQKLIQDTLGDTFGFNKQAAAIEDAANQQAAATKAAADAQAAAVQQASQAQAAQVNQQAQATAQAQQAAINQNVAAQQAAASQQSTPETVNVDLTSAGSDSSDPRRKYQGGASSIGGSSGGVGIRL